MKKRMFVMLAAMVMTLMLAMSMHAFAADVMYANKDSVNVYAEKDIKTEVLKKLKGGEKVLIEQTTGDQKWAAILVEDPHGDGQVLGWIALQNLVYNMPSQYCSHSWGEWEVIEQPTCTASGLRTRGCSICGVGATEDIPALGHNYGDWTVTKQATCTAEGERVHTCKVCGHEETQKIEKKAHNFGDWNVTKKATCTEEGERVHKCKDCGFEEKQKVEKLPHNYGEWTVLKEATCTEEGEVSHKCKDCGFESKETVAKLPHDFEEKIIVEATDHSSGTKTNVCRKCGFKEEEVSYDPEGTLRRGDQGEAVREVQQLLADQNYLNANGADGIFGGGTEKAIMEFQDDQGLTPDGVAWPQTIQRLHHDFGEWTVLETMTRETPGERVRKCKDCDYEQHEVLEPAPALERGARGEDVRAIQQILGSLGFDAGAYDGIYGQMLDNAFSGYAKENDMEFEGGKLTPAQIDALMNSWIASVPKDAWMGEGGLDAAVNLALTVEPAASDEADGDVVTYNWSLTNMGTENCVFTALLLSFGEDPDFTADTLTVELDGEELKANCGNSISGSVVVSKDWGEGALNFSALAVAETNGAKWLSNTNTFEAK